MSLPAPRILVCTADVGCGHSRAAGAITLALRHQRPDASTTMIDALAAAPRWFTALYRDAYLAAVRRTPALTGWLYDRTDTPAPPPQRGLSRAIESLALRRFCESEDVRAADLVICTHFLCARVLSRMRSAGRLRARLAVVVTDQHPHAVWRIPNADLFLVASDDAARYMARRGHDRSLPTGIPIIPRFDAPRTQAAARTMRGLPATAPLILVTGGGLGLGGLDLALDGILASNGDAHAVVVCGRNEALRRRLAARTPRHNVSIIGYTRHMHDLMAAADILVGKPGGLSTAEAAALHLPMVLLRPIPGQEERNASALVAAGAAVLHRDPFQAGRAAAQLVQQPDRLAAMKRATSLIARPDSASRAANAILGLLNAQPIPRPPVRGDEHAITPTLVHA